MTTLHMVSLPIDLKSFRRWAAQRNLAADEGAALHHLLGETFGKSAFQPFRLMVAPRSASATIYAYTQSDRSTLVQTAHELAMPDALTVCDPDRIAMKEMPETWVEGRRLAFDVRVRPVRRLLKPAGGFSKGAEVDAYWLDGIRGQSEGEASNPSANSGREAAYLTWLIKRIGEAAKISSARIVRLEQSVALRNQRTKNGPDVTFHGELEIKRPELFAACLSKGVGRHVAYGYGMMLLRPSRR